MKKAGYLFISYVLVFSLLGVGILQYVFLKKQKQLLEKQIIFTVKNTLNEIEYHIKRKEIDKVYRQIDSTLIKAKSQLLKQFNLDNALADCDTLAAESNIDIVMIEDSLPIKNRDLFMWLEENSGFNELFIEYYFSYLNKSLIQKPLNERISKEELKKIISNVFKKNDLDIPFEFAVYHNGSETAIKSEHFSDSDKYIVIRHKLFEEVPTDKEVELLIAIKKTDIYKDNIILFQILSYLFTAFLMISFLITIYNMMRQKHLSELKNDFINNITHEFKTPIATINLVIDSLKSPGVINDPQKIKHYLKILKKENQRMLSQVEKILFLAKLEQGKVIWNNEPVNVHDIIMEAINHMKLIFDSKGAQINLHLNATNPYVKGDPVFLFDALINLLDNAVKYSGNKKIEITITTRNKKKNLVVEVSDKGVGMAKNVYEKIFDKFYRKPTGEVHNIKGHGIGLTFVKQVVKKMRGDIYVTSKPGEGTTFSIYLPTVAPEETENLQENNEEPKSEHNSKNHKS